MSSESLPLVPPPSTVPPTLPWTLADEDASTKCENAITHL